MKFSKFSVVLMAFVILATASGVAVSYAEEAAKPAEDAKTAADQKITFEESGWEKRCQKDEKTGKEDPKLCEIFKLIRVQESKGRVAEFAIGKNDKAKDGTYSGVVVLPLGILLEEGILFKIDENKPVMFKPRFCAQVGCVSYISLDEALIKTMKDGKKISFVFRSSNGQKVNIDMVLSGFGKALGGLGK